MYKMRGIMNKTTIAIKPMRKKMNVNLKSHLLESLPYKSYFKDIRM